jgi:hypothetical protein
MGKVYIPAGRYLVTRTINLTTGFKKGSDRKNMDIFYHAHTTIEGAGWHATQILGLTRKPGRTDGVVFDCAGSGLITMRDLMITTPKGAWTVDEPYASTMAIFLGRASTDINESTGWYCGEVLLDRIHIKLPSIPEANGNIGTIGIWNNGAESQSYNNINVWANLPVMLSFDRQPPGLPRDMKFESDYVDLAPTGVSTKLTTISGSTTLWAWDNLRPALYMQGEIEVTVNQPSYFARCMSGIPNEKKGNYYFAIEAWFVDHFKHEGDMENFAQYMKVPMFIRNADIKVGIGARYINPGTVLSQLPLIDMTPPENATQPSGFQNANINIGLPIDQEADRAPERIFYVADSATPRLNAKTADPRLPTVVLFQNVKVVGTRGGEHPDAQFASPNLVPYMRFYDFYDYMGNVRIKGD